MGDESFSKVPQLTYCLKLPRRR